MAWWEEIWVLRAHYITNPNKDSFITATFALSFDTLPKNLIVYRSPVVSKHIPPTKSMGLVL